MHTELPPTQDEFVCPKTGRRFSRAPRPRRGWHAWGFALLGIGSLLWFLIRVIPKPSRALYPCMRVAAPFASAFVAWLLGLGAIVAFRRAWLLVRRARYVLAGLCLLAGLVAVWAALARAPLDAAHAFEPSEPANSPLGVGRGIHPGRVAWVWNPDATQGEVLWDESTGYFWDDDHNNQAVIDDMMSKAICWLAGEEDDDDAWDALFRHHNASRGLGDRGYIPGEKIAIKVNLNASLDHAGYHRYWDGVTHLRDPGIYAADYDNEADHTPHAIRALLWQLTTKAGVPQEDIYIGDTIRYWNDKYWNKLRAEFPNVHFMDIQGFNGREQITPSADPVIFYSQLSALTGEQLSDRLPIHVLDAAYMINFAILKKTGPGITVCGKNNFGTITENPVHLHEFIRHPGLTHPLIGDYSAYVDLWCHPDIGGKTFLYLVDALWAGWGYGEKHSMPVKWQIPPFNNDWPSSLFASQDPVAIDSVALDFLSAEDPTIAAYADSYLHEAALIPFPPSGVAYDPDGDGVPVTESLGVHEHWNNPIDKQYSRNLGWSGGIELVSSPPQIMRRLTVESTPISNVSIAATPTLAAGDTPYAVSLGSGATVTLTAPVSVTNGGTRYALARWVVNGVPREEGRANCTITVSAATTAQAVYVAAYRNPIARNDVYTLKWNGTSSVKAPGVLSNDTDPDGRPLTAVLVSGPAHGTLVLNTNGSFTYVPPKQYIGVTSFTYQASAGGVLSEPATVTIVTEHPGNGNGNGNGRKQ